MMNPAGTGNSSQPSPVVQRSGVSGGTQKCHRPRGDSSGWSALPRGLRSPQLPSNKGREGYQRSVNFPGPGKLTFHSFLKYDSLGRRRLHPLE